MEEYSWPIKVDHISITEENKNLFYKFSKENEQERLDGVGIITNGHLLGIITNISFRLAKPIELIEFYKKTKSKIFRTKALPLRHDKFPNVLCREYKKTIPNNNCHNITKNFSLLFRDLTINNFKQKVENRFKGDPFFSGVKIHYMQIDILEGAPFIEYACPVFGFRKIIAPIFFEEKVVGCLNVGRFILKQDKSFIREKATNFFNDKISDESELNKYQIRLDKELEKLRYEKSKTKKIIQIVEDIQQLLEKEVRKIREMVVSRTIKKVKNDFYKSIKKNKKLKSEKHDVLDVFWKDVEYRFSEIRKFFGQKSLSIFGSNSLLKHSPPLLELLVADGAENSYIIKKKHTIKYNIKKIKKEVATHISSSWSESSLFAGFRDENISKDHFLIRSIPISDRNTIITVAEFDDEVWNPLVNDIESGQTVEEYMRFFLSTIFSQYSAILTTESRRMMRDTLRIYGHEGGQIIAALDLLTENYFETPERIKSLSDKKLNSIYKDLSSNIKQFKLLSHRAEHAINLPDPEMETFFPYDQLLFKWINIYRSYLKNKSLFLVVKTPIRYDPLRQEMFGDPKLLEQVVYNLLNNAVKYSHRGAKIFLDCKKQNYNKNAPYCLTVQNYGINVEGEDNFNPFELYSRGTNLKEYSGIGIGLFLCQEIINSHKGQLSFKSKKISDYNIPLIEAYINSKSPYKDLDLCKKLEIERDRLKFRNKYDSCIAKDNNGNILYSPSSHEILDSIVQSTYEVIFTVKIP